MYYLSGKKRKTKTHNHLVFAATTTQLKKILNILQAAGLPIFDFLYDQKQVKVTKLSSKVGQKSRCSLHNYLLGLE
jgi:hypothetical protein